MRLEITPTESITLFTCSTSFDEWLTQAAMSFNEAERIERGEQLDHIEYVELEILNEVQR